MYIRLGLIFSFLCLTHSLFAQQDVLIEFASAKTLSQAKASLLATKSKSAKDEALRPIWYTLQSAGELHLAVVTSSKSLEEWEATPGVLRVKGSTPITQRTRTPNDPSFSDQWDMTQIDAPGAWEYTTGGTSNSGREIVVGVIEFQGVQLDHPDLRDNVYINPREIPNDGIDNDNNGFVDDVSGWNFTEDSNEFLRNNHGTKVFGTLAAKGNNNTQVAGVNWDLKMIPFQVNTTLRWIAALDYLTTLRRIYNQSNGLQGAYVVAANMSIGFAGSSGTCDDYQDLNEAFTRAGEQGILCVTATSNTLGDLDETPDISSNCNSEYLIVVSASTRQDDIWNASGYSTTDVDIVAPGETYTTVDYTVSGNVNSDFEDTSGATPHVTGAIALAYAINCPTLDDISLFDPAGAALLVKDAILSTGDDAIGNAALTTSGKRLNVRKTIESLLLEDCLAGDMIVQFEQDQTPPSTITNAVGELNLIRTLSEKWDVYLYNSSSGAILDHLVELENTTEVRAAEPNIRLILRGRQPNDPGYPQQTNLQEMEVDEGWQTIYGASGTPPPSRVVTAIFDQNFDLNSADLDGRVYANSAELISNGIDDDGNGYIDDANGFNLTSRSSSFSSGNHGLAVASITAANADDAFGIAGIDWKGAVLPLEGNSLADWIEGASYIADIRSQYNQSQGTSGALVVSYVTPQGGMLLRQGGSLLVNVLDELDLLGILTIGATINDETDVSSDFPSSLAHMSLLNTAFAYEGDFGGDVRGFDESNMPLFLPADNTPYALNNSDTLRLSGSSAASALAAGSLALLYQTPCADLETQAYLSPSATSVRLKNVLYRSAARNSGYRNNIVQLDLAAQQLEATCLESSECSVLSIFPNPIPSDGQFSFEVVSGKETTTCPVSIYDALGRVVFRQNLTLENGYQEVQLGFDSWATGVYFLTTGENKGSETLPIVKAK